MTHPQSEERLETVRPEHVILSDTIQKDGYRELTLRVMTKERDTFRFLRVIGGANRFPRLSPVFSWEITGEITPEGDYEKIDIRSVRKLHGMEKRKHQQESNAYWKKHYSLTESEIAEFEKES